MKKQLNKILVYKSGNMATRTEYQVVDSEDAGNEVRTYKTLQAQNYTYYYHYTDKNAPMRIKKASASQENWTEIKTLIDNADCVGNRYIYCLWQKINSLFINCIGLVY